MALLPAYLAALAVLARAAHFHSKFSWPPLARAPSEPECCWAPSRLSIIGSYRREYAACIGTIGSGREGKSPLPELPEVETIKNDLRQSVLGHCIERARVLYAGVIVFPSPQRFEVELSGERIKAVERRAKYLLLRLNSGRFLVIQLMVFGQLLLVPAAEPLRESTCLIIDLDNGQQLRLLDPSHYLRVHLLDEEGLKERLHLDALGPDATSSELSSERFAGLLRGRRKQVKALLLDQHVISGLGNIYVDEVLHEARLHPARLASSLSREEVERLYSAVRRILEEAISRRGTTVQSYVDLSGRKGTYQEQLKVFRRAGRPCPDCPGLVTKTRVAGRETFLCLSCQPPPAGV